MHRSGSGLVPLPGCSTAPWDQSGRRPRASTKTGPHCSKVHDSIIPVQSRGCDAAGIIFPLSPSLSRVPFFESYVAHALGILRSEKRNFPFTSDSQYLHTGLSKAAAVPAANPETIGYKAGLGAHAGLLSPVSVSMPVVCSTYLHTSYTNTL